MADYQHYPDTPYGYGIEIRDGWTTDDYIAQARGFRSTREFTEYRDADEERRTELRRNKGARDNRTESNEDLCRYAAFLRLSNE